MKRFIPFLILFLSIFVACSSKEQEQSFTFESYEDNTPILALVQDTPITQRDFDAAANLLNDDFKKFIYTQSGRANFLTFLISERMLQLDARARGLDKTPEYMQEMSGIEAAQKLALENAKTFALRKKLFETLQNDGTLNVSEEEIKEYYRKFPYEITILQFLLEDPQKAANVMKEMKNVRTASRFADFARQYSIEPLTKASGGQTTPFIPGEYISQIEVAAANSKLLELQGFIKTAQGFHIIMKVGEKRLSYFEAKDRIRQILENQKLDAYLDTLKAKYSVEVTNETK